MSEAFDLVILGGGCAGLSLAMALAALGRRCPRTLVIEPRIEYTNDRTWCYWHDPRAPVTYPIQQRWQTMRVVHAGQSLSLDCGSTPYQMLAAQDFYAAAQVSIDRQSNITLRQGTSVVGEPRHSGGEWKIRTSAGDVTARSVVDTRAPLPPRRDGAVLWQSFYGQEIECSAAVFDPSSMDLMNFLAPDRHHVPFVYILPVTPTRALVEVTVFGATPLAPRELSAQLEAAVAERVGNTSFTTLRREHGILPMGLNEAPRSAHKSCVRVGVMAGGARPSTGYAFQRIQRWASECAHALVSCGHPVGHRPDPWPLRVMDRIFLDVLRADPMRGGALFFSLFSRADPARVIRFLSGDAGAVDNLAVVAAMPVSPFVRAALAMMRRRGRISEVEGAA
jgi:lycopene beta-cyclase